MTGDGYLSRLSSLVPAPPINTQRTNLPMSIPVFIAMFVPVYRFLIKSQIKIIRNQLIFSYDDFF